MELTVQLMTAQQLLLTALKLPPVLTHLMMDSFAFIPVDTKETEESVVTTALVSFFMIPCQTCILFKPHNTNPVSLLLLLFFGEDV